MHLLRRRSYILNIYANSSICEMVVTSPISLSCFFISDLHSIFIVHETFFVAKNLIIKDKDVEGEQEQKKRKPSAIFNRIQITLNGYFIQSQQQSIDKDREELLWRIIISSSFPLLDLFSRQSSLPPSLQLLQYNSDPCSYM